MDFWARGAYHRAKKMWGGFSSKEGTSLRVGADGFYRLRKKGSKKARSGKVNEECINYNLFCRNFGSCDGQVCEYE